MIFFPKRFNEILEFNSHHADIDKAVTLHLPEELKTVAHVHNNRLQRKFVNSCKLG